MADPASAPPQASPAQRGAMLAAGSQVAVAALTGVATIVVARLLGAGGAGEWATAISLVTLLTILTTIGLDSGLIYRISGGRWAPWQALVTAQVAAVVVGTVAAVCAVGARLVFPAAFAGITTAEVALAGAAVPCALGSVFASAILLALGRYALYASVATLQAALNLAFVAALASGGVMHAVAAVTLAQLVGVVCAVWLTARAARRDPAPEPAGSVRSQLRAAVHFGSRTYVANALQFLNFRLDLIIVNSVAGSVAAGRYAVAASLASLLWLAPRALSAVVFPRVAALDRAAGREGTELRDAVENSSIRHAVLASAAAAVVLAVAVVALVAPVYGARFEQSVPIALVLIPGSALLGVANVLFAIILGRGRSSLNMISALIATPITLVLYATLIPAWGAFGGAVASSLSYALSFGLAVHCFRLATGRGAGGLLRPTSSELRDYRIILGQLRAAAR